METPRAAAGRAGHSAKAEMTRTSETLLPPSERRTSPPAPPDRPRVDGCARPFLYWKTRHPGDHHLPSAEKSRIRQLRSPGRDLLKAGPAVIIYCELSGLRSAPRRRRSVAVDLSLRDRRPQPGGTRRQAVLPGFRRGSLPETSRDYYANIGSTFPWSPPGAYELRLTQKDAIAGRSTSARSPSPSSPERARRPSPAEAGSDGSSRRIRSVP